MELYWNFPHSKMSKMEVKMEVSNLNFYYSVILCVYKRKKGIVCGKVAIWFNLFLSTFLTKKS